MFFLLEVVARYLQLLCDKTLKQTIRNLFWVDEAHIKLTCLICFAWLSVWFPESFASWFEKQCGFHPPTQDASHHQHEITLFVGNLCKPLICCCYCVGGVRSNISTEFLFDLETLGKYRSTGMDATSVYCSHASSKRRSCEKHKIPKKWLLHFWNLPRTEMLEDENRPKSASGLFFKKHGNSIIT